VHLPEPRCVVHLRCSDFPPYLSALGCSILRPLRRGSARLRFAPGVNTRTIRPLIVISALPPWSRPVRAGLPRPTPPPKGLGRQWTVAALPSSLRPLHTFDSSTLRFTRDLLLPSGPTLRSSPTPRPAPPPPPPPPPYPHIPPPPPTPTPPPHPPPILLPPGPPSIRTTPRPVLCPNSTPPPPHHPPHHPPPPLPPPKPHNPSPPLSPPPPHTAYPHPTLPPPSHHAVYLTTDLSPTDRAHPSPYHSQSYHFAPRPPRPSLHSTPPLIIPQPMLAPPRRPPPYTCVRTSALLPAVPAYARRFLPTPHRLCCPIPQATTRPPRPPLPTPPAPCPPPPHTPTLLDIHSTNPRLPPTGIRFSVLGLFFFDKFTKPLVVGLFNLSVPPSTPTSRSA